MATVVPAAAGSFKKCDSGTSILELLFCVSGGPEAGFDNKKQDFDILRELVIVAELVDAVAGLDGVTLFAPNDSAFTKLATDLGYDDGGDYDEAAVVGFLAEGLSAIGDLKEVLTAVILYHVGDEELSFDDLMEGETVTTLGGGTIDPKYTDKKERVILVDAEPGVDDPRIHDKNRDIETSQGYFHTITRVLLPIAIL
eukprot:CAMPEP_0197446202 /NCGR_PEP_ID=MMETSP1175-20131217/11207_1 /TAXON_ID=1003142 /ORGANISM="Triceratium dubium, Strain CCMP147" /LENGTH=197 /DNA_ID=CAMNT_0042977279 /DNA_START=160 /DNA_END=753 /DNA_ORIENTATION=-